MRWSGEKRLLASRRHGQLAACQSSEPGEPEKDFYPPSVCGILRVLRVLAASLFRAWDFGAECPK